MLFEEDTSQNILDKDSVSDITEFKVKCEGFCKKNKQVLCDDLSLYREIIDTNVKEDLSNYETVELKKLSQSKLNEKELAHIIYTHNNVCFIYISAYIILVIN
jgi:hypothetical protein